MKVKSKYNKDYAKIQKINDILNTHGCNLNIYKHKHARAHTHTVERGDLEDHDEPEQVYGNEGG